MERLYWQLDVFDVDIDRELLLNVAMLYVQTALSDIRKRENFVWQFVMFMWHQREQKTMLFRALVQRFDV